MPVILAVVLVLVVVLLLVAAALVQRGARRRLAARGQWPAPGLHRPAGEDLTVVTWQQVADLLPATIVDDVQRALDGRRPVLTSEPVRQSSRRLETGDTDPATGYRVIRHGPGSSQP